MPPTTPVARSKTAALTRILDLVPKGYQNYTSGSVAPEKAYSLAKKFHALYGIGCSPAQRIVRKSKGVANSCLILYWPEGAERIEWLLLATNGSGLESEALRQVAAKPRLNWIGYELVRRPANGRTVWTWRRARDEMTELYTLLASLANRQHHRALAEMLERLARQPGFNGIRTQSWQLFQEARRRGYPGPWPQLFYMQKISHGERIIVA